jgi:hypothetical protein
VTERRERRRGKLLDDLKERTGYSHLKDEALNRTMWRVLTLSNISVQSNISK